MKKIDDILHALQEQQARLDHPDELTDRIMDSLLDMEATKGRKRTRHIWLYAATGVAAAACIFLMLTLRHHDIMVEPTGKDYKHVQVAKFEETTPETAVEHHQAITRPKREAECSVVQSKQKVLPEQETVSHQEKDIPQKQESPSADPNIHNASLTEQEDSINYPAASRMDEFLAKMAAFNNAEENMLDCTEDGADSTVVRKAYVFTDTDELNLFGRLLQSACCYDSKTPGYLLTFSHEQFFFCLKDLKQGLKYVWMAERIGDRILLFSSHSSIGVEVSGKCFQEYRNQFTHTNIIPKTQGI